MVTASRFPHATLALGCCLGIGLASLVAAEDALPKGSPFLPTGSAAAAMTQGETIEFAAVRTIGKQTDINLYDTQGKKSHWIPLGGTVDGMTVLNYDAKRDQVVAKIDGVQKVLSLRKPRGVANGPAPIVAATPAASFATPTAPVAPRFQLPAPAAVTPVAATDAAVVAPVAAPAQATPPPAAPAQPLSVARQEEEARMLVSDLLEIGMAQRKAYEEKQRQAADPNAAPAPTPPAPAAQPAPGVPPTGS